MYVSVSCHTYERIMSHVWMTGLFMRNVSFVRVHVHVQTRGLFVRDIHTHKGQGSFVCNIHTQLTGLLVCNIYTYRAKSNSKSRSCP